MMLNMLNVNVNVLEALNVLWVLKGGNSLDGFSGSGRAVGAGIELLSERLACV